MSKKRDEVQENKTVVCLHADHPKPITRRQFLAAGLIPAGGYIMMPSLFARMFNPFQIQDAMGAAGPTLTPLIQITIAGGNCLPHHWISAGKLGATADGQGDFSLSSTALASLGIQAGQTPNSTFGVPLNPTSAFTQTLLATINAGTATSAAVLASTKGFAANLVTNDDSSGNQLSMGAPVSKAISSLTTSFLFNQLGVDAGTTGGGRHQDVLAMPNYRPLAVGKPSDLTNSIGLGPAFSGTVATGGAGFSLAQQVNILDGTSRLSQLFAGSPSLAKFIGGSDYATLAQQAHSANLNNLQHAPNVLASLDTTAAAVWGAAGNFTNTSTSASIVHCVLNGFSPVGTLEIGGGDYHNTGAANFANLHNITGELLGKVLNHAAALGKKVMVTVTTDGSTVCSNPGAPQADGDDGPRGGAMAFFFDPKASGFSSLVAGKATKVVLGNAAADGSTDTSSIAGQIISVSPGNRGANFSAIAFMNYLSTMNMVSQYDTIMGAVVPSASAAPFLVFQGT